MVSWGSSPAAGRKQRLGELRPETGTTHPEHLVHEARIEAATALGSQHPVDVRGRGGGADTGHGRGERQQATVAVILVAADVVGAAAVPSLIGRRDGIGDGDRQTQGRDDRPGSMGPREVRRGRLPSIRERLPRRDRAVSGTGSAPGPMVPMSVSSPAYSSAGRRSSGRDSSRGDAGADICGPYRVALGAPLGGIEHHGQRREQLGQSLRGDLGHGPRRRGQRDDGRLGRAVEAYRLGLVRLSVHSTWWSPAGGRDDRALRRGLGDPARRHRADDGHDAIGGDKLGGHAAMVPSSTSSDAYPVVRPGRGRMVRVGPGRVAQPV